MNNQQPAERHDEPADDHQPQPVQNHEAADDEPDTGGYGLPTPRDEESGHLLPVDHEYDWDGREVTIRLVPPTIEQVERYRNFDDDVAFSKFRDVVDRHVVKPEMDASEMTMREVNCYIAGIIDYGTAGGTDQVQAVRDAVEEREGRSSGN